MYGKKKLIKFEIKGKKFGTINTKFIMQILKYVTQLTFMVKFFNRKIK